MFPLESAHPAPLHRDPGTLPAAAVSCDPYVPFWLANPVAPPPETHVQVPVAMSNCQRPFNSAPSAVTVPPPRPFSDPGLRVPAESSPSPPKTQMLLLLS